MEKPLPKACYSPVCNVTLLREIVRRRITKDYFLFLAHDVANAPQSYWNVRRLMSPWATVIMDNSLIELGGAVNYDVMDKACKTMSPDFIVLPDVLLDLQGTIKAASEVYQRWQYLLRPTQFGSNSKFMAVLQGQTLEEMLTCAKYYVDMDKDNQIGAFSIPRAFGTKTGTRSRILSALKNEEQFYKPVHLLGFSANLADDLQCARMPLVMGIDSATPIRLGAEYLRLDVRNTCDPAESCAVDRKKFFEDALDLTPEMLYNIGYIEGFLAH